jgi:hypothetical protein
MSTDGLPNLWRLYNLRESPFFQDTLRAGEGARYPIDLFVGRAADVDGMLRIVGSSASSRQVIAGPPGIGKTTLAQRVKADALKAGYLSHDEAVRIEASTDTPELLVRLLSHVYEAIVSAGGPGFSPEPVETARQLVRAFRIRSGSASLSVLGIGGGGGVSTQVVESGLLSAGLVVPALLERLARIAESELSARGILVHVNNFENLVEADRSRAADVVRDLRDLLLLSGYHYVFVGTLDALRAVIDAHAQVRSVFGLFDELSPLGPDAFAALLERRYQFLQVDPKRPVVAPVEAETVHGVYGLFHGDLRGALRALDLAAHALAGYGDPPAAPIGLQDLWQVLHPRYAVEMGSRLSETYAQYLLALRDVDEPFTQADIRHTCGVSKGTASEIAGTLVRFGYLDVQQAGRTRRYRRTGAARLALGLPS